MEGQERTQAERRAYAEAVARAAIDRCGAQNGDIVKVYYYVGDADTVIGPVIGILTLNRLIEGGKRVVVRFNVGDSAEGIRIRNLTSITVLEKRVTTQEVAEIASQIYK